MRWRLKAGNGKIIAQSQAYESKESAKKGIHLGADQRPPRDPSSTSPLQRRSRRPNLRNLLSWRRSRGQSHRRRNLLGAGPVQSGYGNGLCRPPSADRCRPGSG
ncbi:DUF1508 domain-containing protein [Nocardia fluminea]|uniref:YegP family protein n=1 Tax=Nocardia fluminea TaxID=134984 RepID=UPI003F4E10FF